MEYGLDLLKRCLRFARRNAENMFLAVQYKTRTADYGLGIKYGLQTTLVKTVQIGSR